MFKVLCFLLLALSVGAVPKGSLTGASQVIIPEAGVDYSSFNLASNVLGSLARDAEIITPTDAPDYGLTSYTNQPYMLFFLGDYVIIKGEIIPLVAYSFPDMVVTEPTTNYPVSFAEFAPNVTNRTPYAGSPEIAEWTRQNDPGDTMALTGESLEDDFAGFYYYSEDAAGFGDIQRLDGQQAAVTLPSTLSTNDFNLMWPMNANGFGEPVGINQTELWWANDYIPTGSTFRVFGENLELSGTSYLYIEELDEWLSTTNCDPYMAEHTAPASMTNGTYTIYAHNGHGQKYGWSDPLSIEVLNGTQFTDSGAEFYNAVTDIGLDNTGATDIRAALDSFFDVTAKFDTWPTIYFPAGTYLLGGSGKTLNLYAGSSGAEALRILGDGTNTIFKITTSGSYSEAWTMNISCAFEDVAFDVYDDGTEDYNIGLYLIAGAGNSTFENVSFSCANIDPASLRIYLRLNLVDNVSFKNCDFVANRSIEASGTAHTFDTCDFTAINDAGGLCGGNVMQFALINCSAQPLDMSDTSNGYGWGSGRWVSAADAHKKRNWYLGGNTTTNMQPRMATPNYFGKPTAIDPWAEFDATYYTQRVYFADLSGMTLEDSVVEYMAVDYTESESYDFDTWPRYPVINFSKADNYVDLKYTKNQAGKDWALVPAATNWTMGIEDYNDYNAGEQFMVEGGVTRYRGAVVSTTSNTTTFADLSTASTGVIGIEGNSAVIVGGRGFGQHRYITSSAGETITLNKSWRVEPDTTSIICIAKYAANWAIYNNTQHADESQLRATRFNSASAGFQSFLGGATLNLAIDGNSYDGLRIGSAIQPSAYPDTYSGGYNRISPFYFATISDNTYTNCEYDLYDGTKQVPSSGPLINDPMILGMVYRGNASSGNIGSAYKTPTLMDTGTLVIYDGNTAESFAQFDDSTHRNSNEVWVGNVFTGDGTSTGLSVNVNTPLLIGNTWTSFAEAYTTNYTVLELPNRTGPTNTAEQTFSVYNSGTTSMVAIANGQTNSIAAESSASFTYTETNATSFAVTGGGDSIDFYVLATTLGGSSAPTTNNNFEFTMSPEAGDLTMTLGVIATASYDCDIDWGDGSSSYLTNGTWSGATHTYASAGDYEVSIDGIYTRVYWETTADGDFMTEVSNLGDMGWESFSSAFRGTGLINLTAGDSDLSGVTSYSFCFRDCTALESIDLSGSTFNAAASFANLFISAQSSLANVDFSDSNITTTQYGQLLDSLADVTTASNGVLNVGSTTYATGEPATDRATMVSRGWTVTDGGQE